MDIVDKVRQVSNPIFSPISKIDFLICKSKCYTSNPITKPILQDRIYA